MTGKDDYTSSEDLIRQARSDLETYRDVDDTGGPDEVSATGDIQDQELERPADRIAPRHVKTRSPETPRERPPPPPSPQPAVGPVGADRPKERRSGGCLAMAAGVVLLIFAALTSLTFVVGLISSDPEVTENVLGYVLLLGMTVVPGVLLTRWARRGRSGPAGYPN